MNKLEREREIARARERADLARLRFGNAVHGVLGRLTPDRLRAEAIEAATDQLEQAKRDLMQRFRHWPIALATAGAGVLALLFWRPAREVVRLGLRTASVVMTARSLWRSVDEQDQPQA